MVALSEDIIGVEILTRLPVKSLVRFRSVCKLWKTLFSSPNFIKYHLSLASQNPKLDNLIVNKWFNGHTELSILNSYNVSETRIPYLAYPEISVFNLMGSINGLVCLLDYSNPIQIILWNPAIRQSKIIYVSFRLEVNAYMCGFSWDSVGNDYKVVMINKGKFSLVYSCNPGCWRSVDSFSFPGIGIGTGSGCFTPAAIVKGVPYWTFTIYVAGKKIFKLNIVKFEARCDEFKWLPEFDFATPEENEIRVVCLKDCVTVMLYNTWNSNSLVDLYCLDEDYGVWRKMYNVRSILCRFSYLSYCFNYGGEIVFAVFEKLYCYDSKTNKAKGFGNVFEKLYCYDSKTNKVKGFGNKIACLWHYFCYTASLVCVDGMVPAAFGKACSASGPKTFLK